MILTADNDTPLYAQLKDALIAGIKSGEYPIGEKIPTEKELSEIYVVSRITVRRAVQEMCEEGYLVKKQGKGTFVKHRKLARKVDYLLGFSETCLAAGMIPSRQVIKCEKTTVSPEDAEVLGLGPERIAVMALRINLADGKPMMVEQNLYPSPKYDFLLEEDLNTSLLDLLWKKHGIYARYSHNCYLDVTRAGADIGKMLQIPPGEPVFFMYENELDENHDIIYIGRQYIIGERYRFNLHDDDRGPAPER